MNQTTGATQPLPPPPPGSTGWPWEATRRPAVADAGAQTWPRISVVVPSYNYARFLEQTLRSLLLPAYPSLQVVVMDGGSTDGTVAVLERYAPWLDHWESKKDKGQTDAINKGFAHCDGDVFVWLNADDYLAEETLWEVGRQFRDGARYLCGQLLCVNTDGEPLVQPPTRAVPLAQRLRFWSAPPLVQPGTFVGMAQARAAMPLDDSLFFTMDHQFFLRALTTSPRLATTDKVLAFQINHGGNKARYPHPPELHEELFRVVLDLSAHLPHPDATAFRQEALQRRALQRLMDHGASPTRAWEAVTQAPGIVRVPLFWKLCGKATLGPQRWDQLRGLVRGR